MKKQFLICHAFIKKENRNINPIDELYAFFQAFDLNLIPQIITIREDILYVQIDSDTEINSEHILKMLAGIIKPEDNLLVCELKSITAFGTTFANLSSLIPVRLELTDQ